MLEACRRLAPLHRHLAHPDTISTGVRDFTASTSLAAGPVGMAAAAVADAAGPRRFDACGEAVYIVGAARTPLGAFQGGLSHLSATELGALAIRAALDRSRLPRDAVGEVFFGNVCSANLGQAPARQAALKAGLPVATDCTTVNKVCSSGLKAIALGAAAVAAGAHDVVVAGGMESMSNVPYYAPDARQGARLGHSALLDGLLRDGLSDALADGAHMGAHADACAARHGISREAQDAHAVESAARARRAADEGVTAWEIVPVAGRPGRGGGGAAAPAVAADEAVSRMDAAKLRRLPPFFNPSSGGTVTAGNSSPISDGAAAVVLASGAAVRRHGLRALARVRGFGDAAQAPADFPTSPALAVPRALRHAGLAQRDVDFWEVNEAFSAVALVNEHLLGLDPARTNVLGGSVAIGHPIGASGARLVVTLLNVLRARGGRVGVAAICNGGGGASAMVLERVDGGGADE